MGKIFIDRQEKVTFNRKRRVEGFQLSPPCKQGKLGKQAWPISWGECVKGC